MVVVERAVDLKMVASAVQSLLLKKWACRLTDGIAVDEILPGFKIRKYQKIV